MLGCGIRRVLFKRADCIYDGIYRFHVERLVSMTLQVHCDVQFRHEAVLHPLLFDHRVEHFGACGGFLVEEIEID